MDSQRSEQFMQFLPEYTQLIWQYDAELKALWYYMAPSPRPSFTPTLLAEIRDLQNRVAERLRTSPSDIHYLVLASAMPRTFNLGGDLELFSRLINSRDRDHLYQYGRTCVDAIYANTTNLGIPSLTTISLVQGSALGGGFEAALSSNVIIAESQAQMGFPEILFNLFPGMGAYSLLSRRIDPIRAERLMRSGDISSAKTLADIGLVDALAPNGEGVHAVSDYIRRHSRSRNGLQAIQLVRQRVAPLEYKELADVVEIWVDAAMRLSTRDLRVMIKIANAQQRLEASAGDRVVTQRPPASVHALMSASA